MTGVLTSAMVNLMGNRSKPADFAPFYRDPPDPGPAPAPRGPRRNASLAAAFMFLKANVKQQPKRQ